MSVNHPRSDSAEYSIKKVLERNEYIHYKSHTWSASDQAWKVNVEVSCGTEAVHAALVVDDKFTGFKFCDLEVRDKLRKYVADRAERDHRSRIVNDTPGELVRSVKLYIEGRDKPHEFNLGPGPCGRTVHALKFLDKGPTLEIHQFCEDQKRADVFTYRIEKLVHWTIYRCN